MEMWKELAPIRILKYLQLNLGRFISRTRISKDLVLAYPTVMTALRYLQNKGYISMQRKGGNRYATITPKGEDFLEVYQELLKKL